MHVLAVNCGSSSIKGKLYSVPSKDKPLDLIAQLSVSNISSKGEKVKISVKWANEQGKDVNEQGEDGGTVEYKSLMPLSLDRLTESGGVDKNDIKYITHRIVHGGTHKEGIVITREHDEGLAEMDKSSEFAPLHNHHAVMAVRSCLDALPDHTSISLFDTLFHQTIPRETYTYALPPSETESTMQLRKYGFHGLSYASIVTSLAKHLNKKEEEINIVVAHLGSGASSCCIKNGKSIDTSMGLTPSEGLLGGTRSGTIDPTTIFHAINDPAADAGVEGMNVTKAESVSNKQSGLQASAGTTNFGTILSRLDASTCSKEEHDRASLAYAVYLDRSSAFVSQYLFKLSSTTPLEKIDGIVFSGGIGEKGVESRRDVLSKFKWIGAEVDDEANGKNKGEVREITKGESKSKGWVVETDEEKQCAELARRQLDF